MVTEKYWAEFEPEKAPFITILRGRGINKALSGQLRKAESDSYSFPDQATIIANSDKMVTIQTPGANLTQPPTVIVQGNFYAVYGFFTPERRRHRD